MAYTNIYNEDAEYDSEADAYRDMSDKYKAEDSVEVGNIYRGESYYELVVGIKDDNVFTKRIDIKDGNQYDINQDFIFCKCKRNNRNWIRGTRM